MSNFSHLSPAFFAAFSNLIAKKDNGSKGKKPEYGAKLAISDYLCPSYQLIIGDQQLIFQIRSQSNPLQAQKRIATAI